MPRGAPLHDKQTPEEEREERIEGFVALGIVLLVALGFIGFVSGWFTRAPDPASPSDQVFQIGIDDDPMLGNASAPVTIIEFSGFACPACTAFHRDTLPRLKAEYLDTGRARFVYRDYPIEELHPNALELAAAASCAGEQGRYWEAHDALYRHTGPMSEAALNATMAPLGLDLEAWRACRESGAFQEEARRDAEDALRRGQVASTPTFFVNGRRIIGAQPYETFKQAIDEALER